MLVAHYTIEHTPILPIGWAKWLVWQYTDGYYFPGCTCAADGDWFNGTLAQMREWFGNYRQVDPGQPKPLQLRSHFDNLHIRQEPRVDAKEVGHLSKGETIELEDLAGHDAWVRHSRGYTAVEIEGYRYMEVVK